MVKKIVFLIILNNSFQIHSGLDFEDLAKRIQLFNEISDSFKQTMPKELINLISDYAQETVLIQTTDEKPIFFPIEFLNKNEIICDFSHSEMIQIRKAIETLKENEMLNDLLKDPMTQYNSIFLEKVMQFINEYMNQENPIIKKFKEHISKQIIFIDYASFINMPDTNFF